MKKTGEKFLNLQTRLKQLNDIDIAELMETSSQEQRAIISQLLSKKQMADVFHLLDQEVREALLDSLSDPEITQLLDEIESDDLVDSLQEMPANLVTELIDHIDPKKRDTINRLLKYPQESVGSLMSVDYVTIQPSATRQDVIEAVRRSSGGYEHTNQIFVIDDQRHLLGFIYLSDLVKASDENIDKLINYNPVMVYTGDDQEVASNLFIRYRLLNLPVIDSEQRLVGIVTADDIFEVISDEIYEDYSLMGGLLKPKPDDKDYLHTGILELVKDRIGWLLFLMLSATFTGFIIQKYETVLASTVVLAAYIPMLMDSGGNSGTQSSTLITRAIATDTLDFLNIGTVIKKEFCVGLIVGIIMALVNFLRLIFLDGATLQIALTVNLTLIVTIIMAKVIGGILPLFAERINQDPAIMSGPLITTLVDTFTLLIYFNIATMFFNL